VSLLSIWWRTRRSRVAGEVLLSLKGGVKGVIVLMVILRSDRIVSRTAENQEGERNGEAELWFAEAKSLLLGRSKYGT